MSTGMIDLGAGPVRTGGEDENRRPAGNRWRGGDRPYCMVVSTLIVPAMMSFSA
jgi:hypothetical protein